MRLAAFASVFSPAAADAAATALALSRQGYDVLINYSKSEQEAKETQSACQEAGADTLLMRGNPSTSPRSTVIIG